MCPPPRCSDTGGCLTALGAATAPAAIPVSGCRGSPAVCADVRRQDFGAVGTPDSDIRPSSIDPRRGPSWLSRHPTERRALHLGHHPKRRTRLSVGRPSSSPTNASTSHGLPHTSTKCRAQYSCVPSHCSLAPPVDLSHHFCPALRPANWKSTGRQLEIR
jgi:hypothetical protein